MKPAARWILIGALGVIAGVALSVVALRESPIAPPRTGAATDGEGRTGELTADAGSPAAVADGGAMESSRTFTPVPATDLRDPEPRFQLVLLPVARGTVTASAREQKVTRIARGTRGLAVQRAGTEVRARPAMLIGTLDAPGIPPAELDLFARGLSPDERLQLTRPLKATVLEIHLGTETPLADVRAVEAVALQQAEQVRAAIYDVETREYFSPGAWRERRVGGWSGDLPQVPTELAIVASPQGEQRRTVTFGMAKFGLPDLVIPAHGAQDEFSKALGTVLGLTAQLLVERGRVDAPGVLRVRIDDVQHPGVREELRQMMRGNARGETELTLGVVEAGEGDPPNRLLELVFPDGEAGERAMRQAITDLFGP